MSQLCPPRDLLLTSLALCLKFMRHGVLWHCTTLRYCFSTVCCTVHCSCNALCLLVMYVLLPWVFFRAFSSVARQTSGYYWQRRGTAHTSQISLFFIVMYVLIFLLLRMSNFFYCYVCLICYCYVCLIFWLLCMFHSPCSVYCLCVNVCCTAATGCQHNVCCTAATGCQPNCG
jgi:hypothetical protein